MKWTPEADAHFFLKVLEVHQLTVDYKNVAERWTLGDEKPTPKALSEHMSKLKKIAAAAAAADGKESGQITPATTPKPRKRKAADDAAEAGDATTPTKRVRKPRPPKTPKAKLSSPIKQENLGDGDDKDDDLDLERRLKAASYAGQALHGIGSPSSVKKDVEDDEAKEDVESGSGGNEFGFFEA